MTIPGMQALRNLRGKAGGFIARQAEKAKARFPKIAGHFERQGGRYKKGAKVVGGAAALGGSYALGRKHGRRKKR